MASIPPQIIAEEPTADRALDPDSAASTLPAADPQLPDISVRAATEPEAPPPSRAGTAPDATIGPPPAPYSAPAPAPSTNVSVRGGNMAMRVFSRAMQDLGVATGGTRAATHEEAHHYVGNALRIEQELERVALSAVGRQPATDEEPANGSTGQAGGDPGSSLSWLRAAAPPPSTANGGTSQATSNLTGAPQGATASVEDGAGKTPAQPAGLPDTVAPFGGYKGGKKAPGDFFQFTQDMLGTTVSHHDAANGIGGGYFKGDQSDIATAAEIAKSTIDGAKLRNDIEDFRLLSSAQYFENLATEDSPYKDQYELIAKIINTQIAMDTAQLDQKVGHEALQYGIFFGQVARQVSAPVEAVMTIKDLADGKISPAEAAVAFATLGHGHMLGSVERMVTRGAKKKVIEKAEETLNEQPKPKPRLATRENIIEDVQAEFRTHLDVIRNIDPEAKVGFRGSLASGTKGPHKENNPFDPNDFDVDALIVSDKLAGMIKKDRKGFRSGSRHGQLDEIQATIERSLRSNPIFSGMRAGRFKFRIYSIDEIRRLSSRLSSDKSFNIIFTE